MKTSVRTITRCNNKTNTKGITRSKSASRRCFGKERRPQARFNKMDDVRSALLQGGRFFGL